MQACDRFERTGTPAAFFSKDRSNDIQAQFVSHVENFVKAATTDHFNPHVTVGAATETFLDALLAELFPYSRSRQRAPRQIQTI
jgi:hypothetical protein